MKEREGSFYVLMYVSRKLNPEIRRHFVHNKLLL